MLKMVSKYDNNKNTKIEKSERQEDSTQYGEFVSSYFGWISPDKQKEKANEITKMTKTNKKRSKKR